MTSLEFALTAHSTLRLLLAAVCAWLFLLGLRGWSGKSGTSPLVKLLMLLATIAADLQLILGLLLYFVWSPVASQARTDFGAAMKDPTLRFWAVEHGASMLLAIACVHLGKVSAGKAKSDASRHRRIALFFGLAIALILAMSPWPFSSIVRPLWRLGTP
ncbi:MAG: hypothetical protein IPJ19_02695 [Planctomycetes bacterium]|nr:hypothetical protein [Planctomycetota bacterium]